jgi:hypothetical protein
MATSSAVDTNIRNLPAADQARTDITTSGTTTTVTVTGSAPLRNLVVKTNTLAPSLKLEGNFRDCSFVGAAATPERFTVSGGGSNPRSAPGGGNRVTKSNFVLGKDSFNDTVKFEKGASARKVTIKDFAKGDTLKYKGDTYKYSDITSNGKGFEGLSRKEIRLA